MIVLNFRRVGLRASRAVAFVLCCLLVSVARGQELVLSEFMAVNNTSHTDENGDHSDWIEIYNPCLPVVDTAGWYLTDDASDLTKWQFPSVNVSRSQFLLVFASGKDRAVAGSVLHTNFNLAGEGEYLALVKPDGITIVQAFSPQYPQQYSDISYAFPYVESNLVSSGDIASFRVPTSDDSALGTGWATVDFDDSAWSSGPTGLGFTTGGVNG